MSLLEADRSVRPALQRLDLNLAEFDDARTVLQRDRSACVGRVLDVNGLLTVQHDHKMRALRRDLIGIPLAAGLRHRDDLGDIDDRAGAVARVRPLVVNVHLVTGLAADALWLLATDEDAAVGIIADPEFGPDLKILICIFGDEISEILALELVSG